MNQAERLLRMKACWQCQTKKATGFCRWLSVIDWVLREKLLPATITELAVAFVESAFKSLAVGLTAFLVMTGIVRVSTPVGFGVFLTTIQAIAVAFLLFGAVVAITTVAIVAVITIVPPVAVVTAIATIVFVPVVYAIPVTITFVTVVYAIAITVIAIVLVPVVHAIAVTINIHIAVIFVTVVNAIAVAIVLSSPVRFVVSTIPVISLLIAGAIPTTLRLYVGKTGQARSDYETQTQRRCKCILFEILDCHFLFYLSRSACGIATDSRFPFTNDSAFQRPKGCLALSGSV